MSSFSHERLVAELAVQRASILTRKVLAFVNKGSISKADSSPVSIADFAAQAILISAIHAAFPSDSFVGEEDSDALQKDASLHQRVWELVSSTHLDDEESDALLPSPSSIEELFEIIDLGRSGVSGRLGRTWMLDPIDGTAAFLRGEQYAVSLALVVDGREMLGVLGCPNLSLATGKIEESSVDRDGMGLMLSAVRGQGAVMRHMGTGALENPHSIPVSREGPADLKDLRFVDYTSSEIWSQGQVRSVAERLGASYPWVEVWSSHMRYAALIVGGGDVQVRIPKKRDNVSYVWDHAGTQLIFTEVGGKITDLEGKEIDFGAGRSLSNNWGIVAAKEDVHGMILAVFTDVLKEYDQKDAHG